MKIRKKNMYRENYQKNLIFKSDSFKKKKYFPWSIFFCKYKLSLMYAFGVHYTLECKKKSKQKTFLRL